MNTVFAAGCNRILNVKPVELTYQERLMRIYQHSQWFKNRIQADAPIKTEIDWRPADYLPPDQEETGLCTGFAGATIAQYIYPDKPRPSETALYAFAAMNDQFPDTLSFCSMDGSNGKAILETMENIGMISWWDLEFKVPPSFFNGSSSDLLDLASKWKIKDYVHLQNDYATVKKWLSNNGPILLDAYVDMNYMNAPKSGIVNVYDRYYAIGGHELVIGGYGIIDGVERFYIDGSWGENHGHNGRCFYRWKELTKMIMEIHGVIK